MKKIAIIGAGKVGTAIGYLLKNAGYRIVGIGSRTLVSARKAKKFIGQGIATTNLKNVSEKADIVFITTSDGAIEAACKKIASEHGFKPGAIVFHTCGALPSGILCSAKKAGAHIGSIHPLQSLADVEQAVKSLHGSYFCIEGDQPAVSVARKIVADLKGKEITLDTDKKPLYHAGAAVVSNFLVATIGFGLELYDVAGIKRSESLKALMPLIKGTIKNIEKIGIPAALTGPIARGDTEIVKFHLDAIYREKKNLLDLYSELGRYTVKVAIEKGTLKKKEAQKIIAMFDRYHRGKDIIESSCH